MPIKIIFLIYGIFLLVGAVIGFKAGSKISLIAGGASALVVFLGVYLTAANPKLGYGILTGTSGLLCVMFLIRFLKTQSFMPAGMILLFSLVTVVIGITQLLQK